MIFYTVNCDNSTLSFSGAGRKHTFVSLGIEATAAAVGAALTLLAHSEVCVKKQETFGSLATFIFLSSFLTPLGYMGFIIYLICRWQISSRTSKF